MTAMRLVGLFLAMQAVWLGQCAVEDFLRERRHKYPSYAFTIFSFVWCLLSVASLIALVVTGR